MMMFIRTLCRIYDRDSRYGDGIDFCCSRSERARCPIFTCCHQRRLELELVVLFTDAICSCTPTNHGLWCVPSIWVYCAWSVMLVYMGSLLFLSLYCYYLLPWVVDHSLPACCLILFAGEKQFEGK